MSESAVADARKDHARKVEYAWWVSGAGERIHQPIYFLFITPSRRLIMVFIKGKEKKLILSNDSARLCQKSVLQAHIFEKNLRMEKKCSRYSVSGNVIGTRSQYKILHSVIVQKISVSCHKNELARWYCVSTLEPLWTKSISQDLEESERL